MKKTHILITCCILFLFSFLLYVNTLHHRFAFDDKSVIVDSRFIHDGTTLKEIFSTNYRYGIGFLTEGLYRPLVILSFVLNDKKLDPVPYHFENIVLNALNSVLLFLLFLILTKKALISFISALIFSFHPIHTEAVANIAGRPELMCAFFIFLAWIFNEKSYGHTRFLGITVISFILALFSKETAVVFPFMMLFVDIVRKRSLKNLSMWIHFSVYLIFLAAYMIIRFVILGESVAGRPPTFINNPLFHSTLIERLATSFYVFFKYIQLLFFPVRLSADYSYAQLPIYDNFLNAGPVLGIIIFILLVALAVKLRNRHPHYTIALIFFIFPYILISNLLYPIGTIMGERLMYLPSAGFSLAVGSVFSSLYEKRKRLTVISLFLVLILFTARTVTRNRVWYDDFSLFSASLKTSPKSAKVYTNMGFLWGQKGDKKTGEMYYRNALDIYPDFDEAMSGLGKNLYDQGRYSESIEYYKRATELASDNPQTFYDYGTVLGNVGKIDEAIEAMDEAIRLSPKNPVFRRGMGNILLNAEDYRGAIEHFKKALELGGNKQVNLNNMAYASYCLGEYREALQYVNEAESLGIPLHPELVRSIRENVRNQ